MEKIIQIGVGELDHRKYFELNDFQGELKSLSKVNYEKLKNQIIKEKFSFAIHVWENPKDRELYIIDGHQRVRCVQHMVEEEGYTSPDLPIIYIEAKTLKEAKRKLLGAASTYGKIQKQGLYEFAIESDIKPDEMKDFDFPDFNFGDWKGEFFEEEPPEKASDTDMKTLFLSFKPASYEKIVSAIDEISEDTGLKSRSKVIGYLLGIEC